MQKRLMDKFEYEDRRRYVKTHFGPEESEERSKLHSDKIVQEKEFIRTALMSQIKDRRNELISRSIRERAEDQRVLEIISQLK